MQFPYFFFGGFGVGSSAYIVSNKPVKYTNMLSAIIDLLDGTKSSVGRRLS
jgi:hypothetical protein